MNRIPVRINPEDFPRVFRPLISQCPVFDSSCSPQARVYYLDTSGGLFLKRSGPGTLKAEAEMTDYLSRKGLAPEVLIYESAQEDWLLTQALAGEDCTHPMYLAQPERLCDSTAAFLRTLHEISPEDCPVPMRTRSYMETVRNNYGAGLGDLDLFSDHWKFASVQEAWNLVQAQSHLLKNDTLIHGDYCLPNVMMDNWRFSGLIDVGSGGVGDRHIDLFWGVWTLFYNLGTHRYTDRFLDAYGREAVAPEMLRLVAACEVFG